MGCTRPPAPRRGLSGGGERFPPFGVPGNHSILSSDALSRPEGPSREFPEDSLRLVLSARRGSSAPVSHGGSDIWGASSSGVLRTFAFDSLGGPRFSCLSGKHPVKSVGVTVNLRSRNCNKAAGRRQHARLRSPASGAPGPPGWGGRKGRGGAWMGEGRWGGGALGERGGAARSGSRRTRTGRGFGRRPRPPRRRAGAWERLPHTVAQATGFNSPVLRASGGPRAPTLRHVRCRRGPSRSPAILAQAAAGEGGEPGHLRGVRGAGPVGGLFAHVLFPPGTGGWPWASHRTPRASVSCKGALTAPTASEPVAWLWVHSGLRPEGSWTNPFPRPLPRPLLPAASRGAHGILRRPGPPIPITKGDGSQA